jgi:hypothetical protein
LPAATSSRPSFAARQDGITVMSVERIIGLATQGERDPIETLTSATDRP